MKVRKVKKAITVILTVVLVLSTKGCYSVQEPTEVATETSTVIEAVAEEAVV